MQARVIRLEMTIEKVAAVDEVFSMLRLLDSTGVRTSLSREDDGSITLYTDFDPENGFLLDQVATVIGTLDVLRSGISPETYAETLAKNIVNEVTKAQPDD